MNRQIKKILIILIIIVILPALFFSIYELNSLNDNEKIISNIYESQLEIILFSLNTTSEDIISRWGNKIASYDWNKAAAAKMSEENLFQLLRQNKSIKYAYSASIKTKEILSYYSVDSVYKTVNYKRSLKEFIKANNAQINRLPGLLEKGYQKFEPVPDPGKDGLTQILFISPFTDEPILFGLAIDSKQFIDEILAARIRVSAHNAFVISVFDKNRNTIIFSNESVNSGQYSRHRQLWLLPQYDLAIKLKGISIQELAEKRINENLMLLFALMVLLITGAVVIIINIRKEMRLAEIKSEFVSNVSHELRTPLALINMFAETLSMGRVRTEEKKQEYYLIISREAGRLSNIVNRILNFSQIEAGKRKYNFDVHDLNEITRKVFETYQFHLKNKGFKIEFVPVEAELPLNCDNEAIAEAVINLIDNGVKYSADKKEIRIFTGEKNDEISVAVEDKGIGISSEDQKRIFEKFFRVSSGLVHNTKGTGLGLTIVKHIIDAHGGKIELWSKPGEGSRFILIFKKNKT
jgi:two-component system phosphate regulon sensor histidine kinase PhoR